MNYGGAGGSSNRSNREPGDPPGPHAVTGTESGLQYQYDDNGNMVSNAGEGIYFWDFKDRLIQVVKENTVSNYTYDYTSQRVIKRVQDEVSEKTSLYLNDEFEIRDGKAVKYVFAGDRRVARIEGDHPDPDGPVTQTLNFTPGWNFFSLEIEPENPAIDIVTHGIQDKFSEIWTFDSSTNAYVGYIPAEDLHDLTELHPRKGYLINVTEQVVLEVTGTSAEGDIPLQGGWNLIGCPGNTKMSVEDATASISGQCLSVRQYDNLKAKWEHWFAERPDFLNDLKYMEPSKAYWVEMQSDALLSLVNSPPEKIFFFHPDPLGSSNLITDLDGAVLEITEYYPYGRPRYEERDEFDSEYKFTGKELDSVSGLMYFEARYYDAVTARFMNEDPILSDVEALMKDDDTEPLITKPQKLNGHSYCMDNPIIFVDPKGLDTYKFGAQVAGGLGAGGGASLSLIVDDGWNIGISFDYGGGGYGAVGASGGVIFGWTNADTIYDAGKEDSVVTGGAYDGGVSVGAEYVHGVNDGYQGANINLGLGLAGSQFGPIEMHGFYEKTNVVGFNLKAWISERVRIFHSGIRSIYTHKGF